MRYNEKKGHWPFMKAKAVSEDGNTTDSNSEEGVNLASPEKAADSVGVSAKVRSVEPVSPS